MIIILLVYYLDQNSDVSGYVNNSLAAGIRDTRIAARCQKFSIARLLSNDLKVSGLNPATAKLSLRSRSR